MSGCFDLLLLAGSLRIAWRVTLCSSPELHTTRPRRSQLSLNAKEAEDEARQISGWPSMNFTRNNTVLQTGPIALVGVLLPGIPARSWGGVNEKDAIGGNSATIVVNVRNRSGDPLPATAVVNLVVCPSSR
jgi:hypothetical protein